MSDIDDEYIDLSEAYISIPYYVKEDEGYDMDLINGKKKIIINMRNGKKKLISKEWISIYNRTKWCSKCLYYINDNETYEHNTFSMFVKCLKCSMRCRGTIN